MGLCRIFAEQNGFLDCDAVVVTDIRTAASDVSDAVLSSIDLLVYEEGTDKLVCRLGTVLEFKDGKELKEPLFASLDKDLDYDVKWHVTKKLSLSGDLILDFEVSGYGIDADAEPSVSA